MDKDISKARGLNMIADKFAEKAAHLVQVEIKVATQFVFYSRLVSRIQKRLVRILIFHLEKSKHDKKFSFLVPPIPL